MTMQVKTGGVERELLRLTGRRLDSRAFTGRSGTRSDDSMVSPGAGRGSRP